MSRALVLIGLSGSGKSTVGQAAAQRLGIPFIDTDRMIEAQAGQSVSALFSSAGENRFRELEAAAIADACSREAVVATGGGAVLLSANREVMRAGNFVLWLDPPLAALSARLAHHNDHERRPLLAGDVLSRLQDLDRSRRSLYAATAHVRLETDGKVLEVRRIIGMVVARYKAWQRNVYADGGGEPLEREESHG